MKYNPDIHHRRSIRLKDYDYSQAGGYFVTICTKDKECLLGAVDGGKMHLNDYGRIAMKCWDDLPNHYSHIESDEFVIMPNHMHGVIVINNVGAGLKPAQIISEKMDTSWQRNYYEHIIRSEIELNKIREYIINNSLNWEADEN